jgi:hypothetical protein
VRFVIPAAFAAGAVLFAASAATAADFLAYEGKPVIRTGEGGTRKVVDGVDFWQSGEPPHRYQVLGTIEDSRHETGLYGMVRMAGLDHDIAKAVHAAGGDGVILAGEGEKVVGLTHFDNASAAGSYGGGAWSAHGSSFGMVRQMKSHQVSYVVVKYLPDDPAGPAAPAADQATPPR